MAENKMKEVAQLLGLELDEEFGIKGTSNRYKFTKNGLMWTQDDIIEWYPSVNINELILGKYKIIKLPKLILDDVEKEYLSAVIKPFKERILAIAKVCDDLGERIKIYHKHYLGVDYSEVITLPYFKPGTMYKGMKTYTGYTVDDLGL